MQGSKKSMQTLQKPVHKVLCEDKCLDSFNQIQNQRVESLPKLVLVAGRRSTNCEVFWLPFSRDLAVLVTEKYGFVKESPAV